MAQFMKVAKVSDLAPGNGRTVEAGGKKIALFNVGGTYKAVADTCLHRGGPIGEGALEGNAVVCPWHHWKYDLGSGASLTNPALKLQTFPVKVEGDDVLVEV